MESSQIIFEKWNCEICMTRFDAESNLPLLFKHCGHTACVNCIKSIIIQARDENKAYVNCYKCRSTHTFTDRETENFMSFPKNFALMQLMERQETRQECHHKGLTRNIICLDNKCKNKAECCFICYKQLHLNCLNELVVQSDRFAEHIEVEQLATGHMFRSEEIKEVISARVAELQTRLHSFVDFCEAGIQEESRQLENLTATSYFEKAEALKSTYSPMAGKIVLSHKNKEYIEVFAKKMNSLLTSELWRDFRNLENASLISNYSYFLKIRTPVVPEDSRLFEKVSGSDCLLLENFLLTSFDVEKFVSPEEVFKKLRDCWRPELMPFKDVKVVHCSQIKKEIEAIAIDSVRQALASSQNIFEVENQIAAKFSSQVFYNNSSNWKCRLTFREPVELKEADCSVSINLRITPSMYACIFYPKELIPQTFSNRRLSLVDLAHHG